MECACSWFQEERIKIFTQLKEQADIVLLQETHLTQAAIDVLATAQFPHVYSACYNSRQRGTAFVINRKVHFTEGCTIIHPESGFKIVNLSIQDMKFCMANIYGPNVDDSFFSLLFHFTL